MSYAKQLPGAGFEIHDWRFEHHRAEHSIYCLFGTGTLQPAIDNNNLSLVSSEICD
jgi:hypothetical protein